MKGLFVISAGALIFIVALAMAMWNILTSGRVDAAQDRANEMLSHALGTRFARLCSDIATLNATLNNKIISISQVDPTEEQFNLVHTYIEGNRTRLITLSDARVLTINGLYSDNVTRDYEIVVAAIGGGIEIVQHAFRNSGLTGLTASGAGVSLNDTRGDVLVSHNGILSFLLVPNGTVISGATIRMLGAGGISVMSAGAPANTLTVSGLGLQMQIDGLLATLGMQSVQLLNMSSQITDLVVEIEFIASLNGTDANNTCHNLKTQLDELFIIFDTLPDPGAGNCSRTSFPVGSIVPWAAHPVLVPDGYLYCDGATFAVPSGPADPYWDIYQVIGSTYCGGGMCANGTLFALPDMRGRMPVGQATTGAFNVATGTLLGEEMHTIMQTELPVHTHDSSGPDTADVHTQLHMAAASYFSTQPISTSAQSKLTYASTFPSDNLFGTCGADMASARKWNQTGTRAVDGGMNGRCECSAVNSFDKNVAIGIYSTGTDTNPPNWGMGLFHPYQYEQCSLVEFESKDYAHMHVNANTGGGMPFINVQTSQTIGGYMIKIS